MTNAIAVTLVLGVAALFALDATVFHWGLPVLAGKAAVDLVEWVSFWR